MAALREQPRLTAARLLGVLLIALAGGLLALALDDDPPAVPPKTATALERALGSERANRRALRESRARSRRASARSRRSAADARRLKRRLQASAARERRLRRALGSARSRLAQQDE